MGHSFNWQYRVSTLAELYGICTTHHDVFTCVSESSFPPATTTKSAPPTPSLTWLQAVPCLAPGRDVRPEGAEDMEAALYTRTEASEPSENVE